MLVTDILDREISIGDEVILNDGSQIYKCKLIKETRLSVAYYVWSTNTSSWNDWIFWTRKSSSNFRNMYKV